MNKSICSNELHSENPEFHMNEKLLTVDKQEELKFDNDRN